MTHHAMTLGCFSVSLSVKDIEASRAFYQKLGFEAVLGNVQQNWLILRNGTCNIGLFQGMFPRNSLTFNPGWDGEGKALAEFTDVRELLAQARRAGLTPDHVENE